MGQQMQFRMQSKVKKDRQMRGMQFHSYYLHRERDRDRLLMQRHASQQPDNHPAGQTVQLFTGIRVYWGSCQFTFYQLQNLN